MASACILVLMGLPGSGKSTLAKKLCKVFQKPSQDSIQVLHVCFDELMPTETLRQLISGDYGDTWKNYRTGIMNEVEQIVAQHLGIAVNHHVSSAMNQTESSQISVSGADGLAPNWCQDISTSDADLFAVRPCAKQEYNTEISTKFQDIIKSCAVLIGERKILVIMDDNMYYRSMRYRYYQLARKLEIGFAQIYVHCDIETALRQNQQREECVPCDIINEMAKKFEEPNPKEPWDSSSLVWRSGQDIGPIMELIHFAFLNPLRDTVAEAEKQREKSRLICAQSELHQVDSILRRLVSQTIQDAKLSGNITDLRIVAKCANECRTDIMKLVKSGGILFDPDTDWSQVMISTDNDAYKTLREAFQERLIDKR